jgi:uncharacterized membrane protein
MRLSRESLVCLILVVASFAFAGVLYGRLPDPVPTHWGVHGQVNGWMPKPWGAFMLPLSVAGTWLLFAVLPRISPRGYRIERFARVYGILQLSLVGLLFLVTCAALLAAVGVPMHIDRLVPASVGVLFAVLGNYLGKVTKNFFVGIRTPWTLASDEVWLRTHRLGGRLFVLAGLVVFVSGLLGGGVVPLVAAAGLAGLVPVVYSYLAYRRLEGLTNGPVDPTKP